MNKKILIASPTYEGMSYCFEEFILHLRNIDYPYFKILIVDNSETKKFFRKIKKIPEIKVIHDETKEIKNMERLISSRNKIIRYAIEKNYDYLLMLDSDVMVPKNILKRLLSHNKDVVSGLYFNVFKSNNQLKLLPVAYRQLDEKSFQKMKEENKLPEFVKSREDLKYNLTPEEVRKGDLLEVLYPSAGCLLLSKKAFSSGARYGLLKIPKGLPTSDDIFFIKELRDKGFKIYCDSGLVCKHSILDKNKNQKNPLYN